MQPPPVFGAGAHSPYRLAGRLHDHSERPAGFSRAPLNSACRMVSTAQKGEFVGGTGSRRRRPRFLRGSYDRVTWRSAPMPQRDSGTVEE